MFEPNLDRFSWRTASEWKPRPWPGQKEDDMTEAKERGVERSIDEYEQDENS